MQSVAWPAACPLESKKQALAVSVCYGENSAATSCRPCSGGYTIAKPQGRTHQCSVFLSDQLRLWIPTPLKAYVMSVTWILGISAFYHDSAACLLRAGEIVAAAQEYLVGVLGKGGGTIVEGASC